MKKLSELLNKILDRLNISQADLVRLSGVNKASVSNICNDKQGADFSTIEKICAALKLSDSEKNELVRAAFQKRNECAYGIDVITEGPKKEETEKAVSIDRVAFAHVVKLYHSLLAQHSIKIEDVDADVYAETLSSRKERKRIFDSWRSCQRSKK